MPAARRYNPLEDTPTTFNELCTWAAHADAFYCDTWGPRATYRQDSPAYLTCPNVAALAAYASDQWGETRFGGDAVLKLRNRLVVQTGRSPGEIMAMTVADVAAHFRPKAKQKKGKRKNTHKVNRPCTEKQIEVFRVVGECQGNFKKAADELGKSRQYVESTYKLTKKKLEQVTSQRSERSNPETQTLPADKDGQVTTVRR